MQRTYTTKPVTVNSNGGVIVVDPITIRVTGGFNPNNEREVVNIVKSLIADSFRDVAANTSNEPVDGGDADPSSVREVVHTYYRLSNAQANLHTTYLIGELVEITNMMAKVLLVVVDDHDEFVRRSAKDIYCKVRRIVHDLRTDSSALTEIMGRQQNRIAKLTGVHPNDDLS